MAYILHKDKPYYFSGSAIYPCTISASSVVVDFKKPVKEKIKVIDVYTESEIKHRLGIKLIDTWDEKKQKVVKVSNKKVSSMKIPNEKETPPEEVKTNDGDETKGVEKETPPEEVKK
ncbi:MAG: hypothetical protein RR585_06770 [Coprobacillus sp.]